MHIDMFFYILWLGGMVASIAFGCLTLLDAKNDSEKVLSARLIVLAPIWPLIAIPWLIWAALGFPWKYRIQKGKVNVIRRS